MKYEKPTVLKLGNVNLIKGSDGWAFDWMTPRMGG